MTEPVCRCGKERIVSGPIVVCTHCDRPCATGHPNCPRCNQLARTCNDCRSLNFTSAAARRCEETH